WTIILTYCFWFLKLRRTHFYVPFRMTWADALQHCRQNYHDLSAIESAQENQMVANARDGNPQFSWIGLYTSPLEDTWLWSSGENFNYSSWKEGCPESNLSGSCATLFKYRWMNIDCALPNTFFCYQWQMELVVVAENKTWEDALVHCRSLYTDLASLLTAAELTLAKSRSAPAQAARVWTSLRFLAGEWLWVDQGPDPGDVPLPPCPARTDRCGARNLAAGVWESRDCQERLSFICYRNSTERGSNRKQLSSTSDYRSN
uniref:C-type lectin domain-containing protein n=1 Tax=Denticeps clupeoides TaxID=299321 RepID=A0AAY4DE51_9TELE